MLKICKCKVRSNINNILKKSSKNKKNKGKEKKKYATKSTENTMKDTQNL